jgi:hypothetical protein
MEMAKLKYTRKQEKQKPLPKNASPEKRFKPRASSYAFGYSNRP